MKKRITIKDIAKELNVHHSTVSRALRNDPRVTQKTRETVLAYAREHEFQINMNAVMLRGKANNAIALIVPNINHNFFSDIISQLTNLAYKKGYVISVFQTNEKYQQEKEIINTIVQHNFAGVIVSIAKDTVKSDHFSVLRKFGIPLVFFDRVCEDIIAPKVKVNNVEITQQSTERLLEKGFKRIAHFTGTQDINVFRDRERGYNAALDKHKMEYRNSQIITDDFSLELGRDIFTKLWNSPDRPDAIISSSVHLTMGILLHAKESGIEIPKDLGIITFGTLLSSVIIQPLITSIEQPENEIAEIAFELLENMIIRDNPEDELIEREVKARILDGESAR